jgi:UDP-3-O-[3-hydroxymyristoyl] N-acetylglucosamine deacetylase
MPGGGSRAARRGAAMVHRQTLASEVTLDGVGLHSGKPARMRFVPAEPTTGVVFVRTDEEGVPLPATLDFAGPSFYATVLQRNGVRVSTIEHVMAALYALQIDDLRIELDGPEVPILDGSSRPFVDAILAAGRVELPVERRYMILTRPIVVSEQDKRIAAYPAPEYRVTYAIDFDHPVLGYQELSVGLWREGDFAEKLAPARTFTFEGDVAKLRENGLALGGSLDNALVIGDDGILNPRLRFPDEFVRHKMLDLTGDLSLLGRPLCAHVVAYRAGHDLHARLARRIWNSPDCWYVAPWAGHPAGRDAAAHG